MLGGFETWPDMGHVPPCSQPADFVLVRENPRVLEAVAERFGGRVRWCARRPAGARRLDVSVLADAQLRYHGDFGVARTRWLGVSFLLSLPHPATEQAERGKIRKRCRTVDVQEDLTVTTAVVWRCGAWQASDAESALSAGQQCAVVAESPSGPLFHPRG